MAAASLKVEAAPGTRVWAYIERSGGAWLSNRVTRVLGRIVEDLKYLTRRGAEGASDMPRGAARFAKHDVAVKVQADQLGGDEVGKAGGTLATLEHRPAAPIDPPHSSGGMSGGPPGSSQVTTGLGRKVDRIVSLSPKSAKRIKEVQEAGWTIRLGPAPGGTYTHRSSKVITIAENLSAKGRVSAILHEVGHAHPKSKRPPTIVIYRGEGRENWALKCAQPHFRDEGQAVFQEVEGLREIADNGGPIILPASSKPRVYLDVYDRHLRGEMTKEGAIREMGERYADESQSDDGRTYRSRFTGEYAKIFDQNPMDEVFAQHGPFEVKVHWPGGDP
ncbi:hypothetical protein [Nocardia tengchongensis]|uniref:hypothetical protein n=1 Tax=Nocardia tengchongensis TaxID=2055889 RepID=UPI0036938065